MKISLKKVIKAIIYSCAGFLFVTLVWIYVWIFDIGGIRMKTCVEGHKEANTYNELCLVAKNIIITNLDADEKSPMEMYSLMKWLDTYSLDWKDWRNEFEDWFDPNTGTLIDRWGTPIELQVKSPREYVLISSGPNHKFENGKGDDIVYSFNPYEYVEEKEKSK